MNTLSTTPSSVPRLARMLSCVLLPALLTDAWPRPNPPAISSSAPAKQPVLPPPPPPYLVVCLPPALRFAEAIIPIVPTSQPTVGGPPIPGGPNDEATALNRNGRNGDKSAASGSTNSATAVNASTNANGEPVPTPLPLDATAGGTAGTNGTSTSASGGITLLPDETPREIRAEDVIPYFRYPAAPSGNITPPPSSATYRQQ